MAMLLTPRLLRADDAEVPFGTYTLDVVEERPVYRQSKKRPSCGEKVAKPLAALSSMVARYSSSLLVNDAEWKIKERSWDTKSNGKAAHGVTTKDGVHISLYFRREGSRDTAWGMLFLFMKGMANQTVCIDAYELAGTFEKPKK
ncbi:MAG: hypothetical protein ACKV2T_23295 [Kofleriaceae bacterium]